MEMPEHIKKLHDESQEEGRRALGTFFMMGAWGVVALGVYTLIWHSCG